MPLTAMLLCGMNKRFFHLVRNNLTNSIGSPVFALSVCVILLLYASTGIRVPFSSESMTLFELLLPANLARCGGDFVTSGYGVFVATGSTQWAEVVLSAVCVIPFLYVFTAQYRSAYYSTLSRMTLRSYSCATCVSAMLSAAAVILTANMLYGGIVHLLLPSVGEIAADDINQMYLSIYGETTTEQLRYVAFMVGNDMAAGALCGVCSIWLCLYLRDVLLIITAPMFLHYASAKLVGTYQIWLYEDMERMNDSFWQALQIFFPHSIWSMDMAFELYTRLPYVMYLFALCLLIVGVSLLCGKKIRRRVTCCA